ncbi:bone morphogenetic protein 2-like [Limulus polyphemus]|uniref:Bone morphogenetic protein 2-like n=1 Tax=Limulus polyphemus TaxID=6850 RepID=A0ABM1T990_LIMPO|nr:bone morphogenetic protein 2-like [Limulus polyphemus]
MAFLKLVCVLCLLVWSLKLVTCRSLQPLDANEKQEAINRLLQIFNINTPGRSDRHLNPPQYMLDLYNALADSGGASKSPNPYKVNIVRSFPDKDQRHNFHFYFNITDSVPATESVVEAEFHLYRMKPKEIVRRKSEDMRAHLLELRVYQVMPTSISNKDGDRLLDIRLISAYSVGWEVFYVKPAVIDWMNDPQTNLGLLITVKTISGNRPDEGIMRFARRHHKHANKQPILVLFNEEDKERKILLNTLPEVRGYGDHEFFGNSQVPSNPHTLDSRYGQSQHLESSTSSNVRVRRSTENEEQLLNVSSLATNQSLSCNRFEMYVDFEQIGWSDWILSPKGYRAFYCKGRCDFPFGQNEHPSNHATVQSIVNKLNLVDGVPEPSCVPNKLSAFLLLYRDDGGSVVLRRYANMVADSCGCH